jgi:hypothetical protein
LKKQPAVRGEIKKTKMRTKLQKSVPELFSVVEESYMNIDEQSVKKNKRIEQYDEMEDNEI